MSQTWNPRQLDDISSCRLLTAGLRSTRTRLRLLDLFEQQLEHPLSCEEVYVLMNKAGFAVSLATTYSNVRAFVRTGVLMRGETRARVRIRSTYSLSRRAAE